LHYFYYFFAKGGTPIKATFEGFISTHPSYKKFADDVDMINTFNMLSQDNFIMQLIEASDFGKPAISAVVQNIEHVFSDPSREHVNSLDDNFTRQCVGTLVKYILQPFGYRVWKQNDLPKLSGSKTIKSASVYRFDPLAPRSMKVIKQIVEIN
jgi:dynactin complex subunit